MNAKSSVEKFMYDGAPVSCKRGQRGEIEAIARRYAPLLRIAHGDVEVDWGYYAGLADDDRDWMVNSLLVAFGVLTLERLGNIAILLRKDIEVRNYDRCRNPTIEGRPCYFHKDRSADAMAYIELVAKINRGFDTPPRPDGLVAVIRTEDPKYQVLEDLVLSRRMPRRA